MPAMDFDFMNTLMQLSPVEPPGFILLPGLLFPLVSYILIKEFYKSLNALDQAETGQGEPVFKPLPKLKPKDDNVIASQLESIRQEQIPELLEKMPANSWHKETWYQRGKQWRFTFECNSESRRFFATALGATPMEAFLIMRHRLLAQIADWHTSRFETTTAVNAWGNQKHAPTGGPRVLIVDDDIDMALAMQTAFGQLGCETEVATSHEGLHRKLVTGGADYIFLDWRLNNQVTADQVVEKAVRYLDTFSDLRERFTQRRPLVITHSVLEREQVHLPNEGNSYFNHLDHWQKPLPFHEVVKRVSELLAASPHGMEA